MNCNVGGVDRVLRVIVGIGLLSIVFVGPQTAWGWIGAVPLLHAIYFLQRERLAESQPVPSQAEDGQQSF